jgi:hypothetical protein
VRVLRVDVENLQGSEWRQQFAVVHVAENRDRVTVVERHSEGCDLSHGLVAVFRLFERLGDPKTAVLLDLVQAHDNFFAVLVVVGFSSIASN